MSFDAAEFRKILGHLVTGVTVVAATDADDRHRGLTANAVTSVSIEPPLVLVCVDRASDTHDTIVRARRFAISVLGSGQRELALRFADSGEHKFDGVAWRPAPNGAPVLEDAMAWVACRLWAEYDGGDHTIFVGEVVGGDAAGGEPLVFYRGGYGRYEP